VIRTDWIVTLEIGGLFCLFAGGWLMLVLRLWPRVFLRRYPEEIRAAVSPLSAKERMLGWVIGLPFFAMLVGFPTWAARAMDASHAGDAMFLTLFTAAFTVWMMFNLFDWLVLDELWIGRLRPRWLVLPGTEHIPMSFHHAEHAVAFVKGTIGGAAVAAVVALAVNRAGAH
jgi:hypothetical protein